MSSAPVFQYSSPDPRMAPLLAQYPPTLFNTTLFQSVELAHRYVQDWTIRLLHELALSPCLDVWRSAMALAELRRFHPRFRGALAWLLEFAAANGLIALDDGAGEHRYRLGEALYTPELAGLRSAGIRIDPANAATLDLLDAAAAAYPKVAAGALSGEQALSGIAQANLWLNYFNNANPPYAVNNWIAAHGAAQRLAGQSRFTLLEVGAGAASGSEALLRVLAERGPLRARRFTSTNRIRCCAGWANGGCANAIPPYPCTSWRWISTSPGAARAYPRRWIWCMRSTPCTSRDLPFSLGEARAILLGDGWLVAGECLRPAPGHPIYVEIIFQLLESFTNVRCDPLLRPNCGFLTPEQWRASFRHAGFQTVEIEPDLDRLRALYPRFYSGAVCGRSS
ncbi:MAG: hypothetical protein U1F68_11765 [Gammaproteobacteria bacterium]